MKGRRPLRNERGSVLLFMIGTLLFLLVFGGFAVDLSFLSVVKGELQRSMDAAALAGAGHLGFDDSVFPTVRQEAWKFADLNPARVGAINLDQNPGNDPNGDIVLGVWDGATFTPSLVGSVVNAVRAQYATEVPTAFLRILGFNTLPVSAQAIALSPMNPNDTKITRFLVDGEMIDSDIPVIMDLAAQLGMPPEDLISDLDGDWFIDLHLHLPPGTVLELPTGQVGDAALFDMSQHQFPFSASSSPSHADFLNWNDDSTSWRYTAVPLEMLDPLRGVTVVDGAGAYPSYVNPDFIHVSPVTKSDNNALNPVNGVPAINTLALRRGLLAFKIIGIGADPDGPGGTVLPNLIIQLVDPNTDVVSLDEVVPFTRRRRLVR